MLYWILKLRSIADLLFYYIVDHFIDHFIDYYHDFIGPKDLRSMTLKNEKLWTKFFTEFFRPNFIRIEIAVMFDKWLPHSFFMFRCKWFPIVIFNPLYVSGLKNLSNFKSMSISAIWGVSMHQISHQNFKVFANIYFCLSVS